jgi:transposase
MRGRQDAQGGMFYVIDVESRIREDHPLRPVKRMVDAELRQMSGLFNRAYSGTGRPSVPPERLLKAMLLQALYSVRSERQLVERIDTDLLFRWFLDMDPAEDTFDATAFTHNRERLEKFNIVGRFFDGIVRQAMEAGLTSDEHFSVDGTLIQSYASLKSIKRIEDGDDRGPKGGSRNEPVDFRGHRRTNATHRSTTDPEARLYRKGWGQPAYLYHSGHVVTENRHGLVMAVTVAEANGHAEREEALSMLAHLHRRHGIEPVTLAADKGYYAGEFLGDLETWVERPYVAVPEVPIVTDDEPSRARRRAHRRTRNKGYALSQRRRKLVEEAFGWAKTIGGLRRILTVGRWKLKQRAQMVFAGYNLIRLAKLVPT